MALKWVPYDGTEETLPSANTDVLIVWEDMIREIQHSLIKDSEFIASHFHYPLHQGVYSVRWMYIPTPAQLASHAAVVEAARGVSDMVTIMSDGIMDNSADAKAVEAAKCMWDSLKPLDDAFAKLDALAAKEAAR